MYSLGFLGAGWMGGAILGGINEHSEDAACLFFDASKSRCEELEKKYGIAASESIGAVMDCADAAVIAVKPQVYPFVAEEIAAHYREGLLLVSVMAGISMADIGKHLPSSAKIIRLMPNMAMAVGAGVCLLTANENVTEAEKARLVGLLSPLGLVKEIPEHLMDAGTALSGSGPAFFYSMVDAMMLGGVQAGFSRNDALALAVQTMAGAAALLEASGESPGALRDQMMSAGGTTIEGVATLEQGRFRGDVIKAVAASCRRSKELSKGDK